MLWIVQIQLTAISLLRKTLRSRAYITIMILIIVSKYHNKYVFCQLPYIRVNFMNKLMYYHPKTRCYASAKLGIVHDVT